MVQRGSLLKAALLGGVLSATLSSIPALGLLCCIWVTAGGLFAAWVLSSDSGSQAPAGRLAFGGLLAGAVGGVLAVPLTGFVTRLQLGEEGLQEQAAELRRQLGPTAEQLPPDMMEAMVRGVLCLELNVWTFGVMLLMGVVFSFFGLLGGLLGGALFARTPEVPVFGEAPGEIPPTLPPMTSELPPVSGELSPDELPELPPADPRDDDPRRPES